MIAAALSLFLLRDLPLSAFDVPRWQTAGVLGLLGVLVGMSLASLTQDDGTALMSIPQALLLGLGLNALLYGLVHGVLRWWLMRDGRWNGQGPFFNLLLAAGLVPNVLSALLESLELPAGIAQPLGLVLAVYGLWVVARAVSSAIPDAPPRYSMAGVALASVSSVLVLMVVATLATPLLVPQDGVALGMDGARAGQQASGEGQGASGEQGGSTGPADGKGQDPDAAGEGGAGDTLAGQEAVPRLDAPSYDSTSGSRPSKAAGDASSESPSAKGTADCAPTPNYRQRPDASMHHERFDRHGDPRRETTPPCKAEGGR